MTSGRRKSKKDRRAEFVRTSATRAADKAGKKAWHDLFGGLCPNGCGQKGPHYVPGSFGEPGFFACASLNAAAAMKEPGRIIPPMRLDELEQICRESRTAVPAVASDASPEVRHG